MSGLSLDQPAGVASKLEIPHSLYEINLRNFLSGVSWRDAGFFWLLVLEQAYTPYTLYNLGSEYLYSKSVRESLRTGTTDTI